MDITSFEDLLVTNLVDLIDAENQIADHFEFLIKNAHSRDLKEIFVHRLEDTELHINRLATALEIFGIVGRGERSTGIRGILQEGERIVTSSTIRGYARTFALITVALKVEAFKVVSYKATIELAEVLGLHEVVSLLEENLHETIRSKKILTRISRVFLHAESMV